MIRHLAVCFAISAALIPQRAEPQVPAVTLDDALRLFAANNLELRLSRSELDHAAGLARQASAFPNPTLSATHEPLRGGGLSYSETYVTASQRVELPGSRGARSAAGQRRRDAAAFALRADSMRLAFEVKRAFVEAGRAQEMLDVTQRIAGVFRSAEESAGERHEEGDISLYALRRIRMERAHYETLSVDAELEVDERQSEVALLVDPEGRRPRLAVVAMEASGPPSAEAPVSLESVVDRRAELLGAEAIVEAEDAQARLSRADRVPDLTATGGFKSQSDGLRGAYLGLSLPVPIFDRGGGAIEAADAGARGARERVALTRRHLENDVRHTTESYATLQRRSGLVLNEGDAEADDLLDIALVAYEEGEMELVELLDAADALYDARAAEARLRASLWIAYFDLERAVGGFDESTEEDR